MRQCRPGAQNYKLASSDSGSVPSRKPGIAGDGIVGILPAASHCPMSPGESVVFRLRSSPADDLLREIRAEQLHTLYRQMPIAVAVNAVNAAITAIVLERLANLAWPAVWFCAVLLVTAARTVLWLRYRRAGILAKADGSWAVLAAGGALAAGLCWGVGGALLFAVLPVPGQMFLTVIIGGMCAGAVVMSASHLSTALAFLLSASLPFAMLFFCQGTTTGEALGAMILVFAAALSLGASHFSLFFTETIRLRLELSRANGRPPRPPCIKRKSSRRSAD
jgi:hypothetical protein